MGSDSGLSQLPISSVSPFSATRPIFGTRRSPSVPIVIDYSESEDEIDDEVGLQPEDSRSTNQLSKSYDPESVQWEDKHGLFLRTPNYSPSGSISSNGKTRTSWSPCASSHKTGARLLSPVRDTRRHSQSPSPQSNRRMRAAQPIGRS